MIRALLSIHDVMPETLHRVGELLELIRGMDVDAPALLVVPDRHWQRADIEQLRDWAAAGSELIAHGWQHETRPRRLYHRLHSLLLSRNVAEHLAYDADGIVALMLRSRSWFIDQDLAAPDTYIPPAWALGMPPANLGTLPFRVVETLRGVHLRSADGQVRFHPLPLLGFEADTALRARFLTLWNRRQARRALRHDQTLRIGIHPHDLDLHLAGGLRRCLREPRRYLRYRELEW